MKTALSNVVRALVLVAFAITPACGGGGDGGGGITPVTVASVTITPPGTPINFGALGRTVQLTAVAKDAGGATLSGVSFTWGSSNTGVATVSSSGLVTAVANGTTQITATSGGVPSAGLSVSVAQVPVTVTVTPGSVLFGAIGKTRQLSATVADSTGNAVAGAGVTWTRSGPGTVASVSAAGLATALAVGTGDSAVATSASISGKSAITVTQVVTSVTVTSTSGTPDTLFSSTRTRQFSATARDSNSNIIGSAAFAWTSSVTAVATVNGASGLVTAGTTDGATSIQATASGVNGARPLVVNRFPSTFTISPPSASITTAAGTQVFTGTVMDSAGGAITPAWLSKNTAIVTVSPASGGSTTATAAGNGSTHVVMTAGTRRDSAAVTVTNQPVLPTGRTVNIGDDFFRSAASSAQPALDTIAVGGSITWNWTGVVTHSVQSTGSPSFTSSTIKSSGSYVLAFNSVGTYTYNCAVHGNAMTGTVVVR